MQMYNSYLETSSEEDAKALVVEAMKEQIALFTGDDHATVDADTLIKDQIDYYTQELEKAQTYDAQLFYSDKVDTLTAALEILTSDIR